ncbi:hypothetical protein [Accumulibacter sp.]|uniref:hypothetical protein n=1 Tax=Accumulibacter sp. TaxID=2053492 RepID=UPI0025F1BEED|nr:hypothetical protein [Accumulibacter sp.]MCM8627230.1 hypothetical protein [Accumulibacter sp.]
MSKTNRLIGLVAGALISVSLGVPAYADSANSSRPYDPSSVGQPSGNGNGNGNALGKPAAGTVGNADAKNPPGQLPFPDDNNGYECDDNSGIGLGNPAHSFCDSPS